MIKISRQLLTVSLVLAFTLVCVDAFATEPSEARLPMFAGAEAGIISLALDASPFTGESSTSVPIELLPSTGDVQEKLSLTLQYRSGGGNSWAGKGWELEAGYIAKINKFGANNSNNPYLLVLNGQSQELVNTGGNQYRTKMESNRRIQYNGSSWSVWEKDGTEYKFENFTGGKWVLTRITETHGISVVIEYDRRSNEEIYLREIRYPEGSGLSGYCKVTFATEERQDKIATYYYGSLCKINRRLKEIQILAEGTAQKRYSLDYATNGTSQSSLLSSVTEYGKDGSILPPTRFEYQQPLRQNLFDTSSQQFLSGTKYTYEGAYQSEISLTPHGLNMAVIDLNGDNLPDLIGCKLKDTSPVFKYDWLAYFNTGNGFSSSEAKWLDSQYSYTTYTSGGISQHSSISLTRHATLADMNKDGLPDLVYSKLGGYVNFGSKGYMTCHIMVRYNTGGKFSDAEVKLLDYSKAYHTYDTTFYRILIGDTANLLDMNGDGLPDLVYNKQRSWVPWGPNKEYSAHEWTVRLNTGNGFSDEEKAWLSYDKSFFKYTLNTYSGGQVYIFERININDNSLLIDMNRDGLPDLVFNDFSRQYYVGEDMEDNDLNLTHVPQYSIKVRFNTGSKFTDEASNYFIDMPVYAYVSQPLSGRKRVVSTKIGTNAAFTDINNDGLTDFIFNEYSQGPSDPTRPNYRLAKVLWKISFNSENKFENPIDMYFFGQPLDYFFNNNRQYANVVTYNSYFIDVNNDNLCDLIYPEFTYWQNKEMEFKIVVLKNKGFLASDLMISQVSPYGGRTDISYEPSSKFDNTGGDGKNDLAFVFPVVKTSVKNPGIGEAGTTSYSYQYGLYDIPNREFRGFRHIQVTDPLNYVNHTYFHQDDARLGKPEREENPIARTLYTYKSDSSAPYFTPVVQTDEYTDSKCNRTVYEYDDYGNVIKTLQYGDIGSSGDEKSIFTDYAINSSTWLVNLPSREKFFANTDGSGTPACETQYFYDGNSNYSDFPSKGDLTKAKSYLDTISSYIETSATYDAYGNPLTKTDARRNITSIEYDSAYHSFPITVTNPKGHIERTAYYTPSDSKGLFGQLKSKTDANNNQAAFEYDGFGRKTKAIGPYDQYSVYGSESYEYGVNGPGANYTITRTTEDYGTSNNLSKADIMDGFERVVQSAKETEDSNMYSYVTTEYNARGEVSRVSLPEFNEGGIPTSYRSAGSRWAQYSYDAIGRIIQIINPDNTSINNSYNGWSTTVTDENTHQKTFIKDAHGRLIGVKERNQGVEYNTSYTYDALNNLTLITDHSGNRFEFYYDTLKRRIRMVDPDLGAWAYEHDNNGNLVKITNANNKVINFSYDELNRNIAKDYAAQTGVEFTYNYDENTSTNGIGRRTSMRDPSGRSYWNYDKEGRTLKLDKIVSGAIYSIEWLYDAMDRAKSIILPNQQTLNFRYNNAGLAESVEDFVENADYNASGQISTLRFANPLETRFDYYAENQRLKSIITGSLQDLNYEYDGVGNIKKIIDAAHAYGKEYIYDDLDRLASGDGDSYEYNAIGNLTKVNGVIKNYSSSAHIHALTNDGINAYSYDNCGNMISGAGRTIVYDAENHPIKITKNEKEARFIYDGDGKRVKKTVNDGVSITTTIYIEGLYEKESTE